MKWVRVCLLVLLAVLLPVRGAVAAAMQCPPAGVAGHGHDAAAIDHAEHAGAGAMDGAMHGHAEVQADATAPLGHQDADAGDKCSLCGDLCSMTPMPANAPPMAFSLHVTALVFAAFAAPAPSFLSDGEERPPRTC